MSKVCQLERPQSLQCVRIDWNPQGSRPSPSEQQDSLSAQRWTNLNQNQSLSSPFPSSFFNSGASGGLPMTHRAGGESHGPLGLTNSRISEIARPREKFWVISRPSGVSQGTSRALSRSRSHRKRSDNGSQRSPGRRRACSVEWAMIPGPRSPLRAYQTSKSDLEFADSAHVLSHFGLVDPISISYRQTAGK